MDQVAVGVHAKRGLDVVGLPHVVAPRPRALGERIVGTGGLGALAVAGPLPRGQIAAHGAQERRQRRDRGEQRDGLRWSTARDGSAGWWHGRFGT
ncbi:hypothetical protein BGK72_01475 [Streptomyces agglomeratus]|nr:hypothetical protein BGK72_01475 [Streptomyces agglomeratus]